MADEPHESRVPGEPQITQCSAHSKRTGEQCKRTALLGARVCYYHGGAAPQVKAKAMERILAMVDPALHHLGILIEEGESDAVRLSAIRDVLDRAGYGAKQSIAVSNPDGTPLFPVDAIRAYMAGVEDDKP